MNSSFFAARHGKRLVCQRLLLDVFNKRSLDVKKNMPFAFLFLVLLTASCLLSSAVAQQPNLLWTHPCGPDSLTGPLRKLIPQGAFGADFRPACRAHDTCYHTPGADRTQCDRKYLQDMRGACENATHPTLCRMTASILYRVTHKRGQTAFQSAQRSSPSQRSVGVVSIQ